MSPGAAMAITACCKPSGPGVHGPPEALPGPGSDSFFFSSPCMAVPPGSLFIISAFGLHSGGGLWCGDQEIRGTRRRWRNPGIYVYMRVYVQYVLTLLTGNIFNQISCQLSTFLLHRTNKISVFQIFFPSVCTVYVFQPIIALTIYKYKSINTYGEHFISF